ncbi:MAG: glycoside hydrolase family 88 protein [Colwellia sp.]|nr:glycoside hydrolase family 88 protein [Colwellia sp.]
MSKKIKDRKALSLVMLAMALALGGCTNSTNMTASAEKSAVTVFKAPKLRPYTVDVVAPMYASSEQFTKAEVKQAANLVADWQIRHQEAFLNSPFVNYQGLERYSFGGWLMGTMAIGMAEWGQVPDNEKYLNFIRQEAEKFNWQVESRIYHADDYIIGHLYLELYQQDKQARYLAPLKKRLDYIHANWLTVNKESTESCVQLLADCHERWTWIDALFMGGPVWANMAKTTGDNKYLEFAEHEYWASFDKFWDEEESLLFRDSRFITARDVDGKKVFWNRGNGWVFASLVRMLDALPEGHASREKYIARFKSMAKRIAELQEKDGSWHPSLLNPELFNMPESSGAGFFTYAMAWGVNNGVLEKEKYQAVIERSWANLTENIYADGRLGYVQASAFDPRPVHKEDTDVYGVGSFLLAASEVYLLAE